MKTVVIEERNTPFTFATRYLATYYSIDYRVDEIHDPIIILKHCWYWLLYVTVFKKTRNARERIGYLIVKDPNKTNRFQIVFEAFEKGYGKKS